MGQGLLILNLFFAGAIAFVPNDMSDPSDMTAYLLNVHHCGHIPLLIFELEAGSECGTDQERRDNSGCDILASNRACCKDVWIPRVNPTLHLCACGLRNTDLSLDPLPERRVKKIGRPSRSLPEGNGDQGSIDWLLKISSFNPSASRIKTWGQIRDIFPRPVAARIDFSWEEARACHVDQNYPYFEADDDGRRRREVEFDINKFFFVKFDNQGQRGSEHEQALAEYVKFSGLLPVQPVRIVLRDLYEPAKPIFTLKLHCPAGRCPDVLMDNEISWLDCDDEEEKDIGEHFADYYILSRNLMPEKLIPRRRRDLVTVAEEFSCLPNNGHPVAKIRAALVGEVRDLFKEGCPSPPAGEIGRIRELIKFLQIFGRGSVELVDEMEAGISRCLGGNYKTVTENKSLALPALVQEILNAKKGISTRVICPMAMFDP